MTKEEAKEAVVNALFLRREIRCWKHTKIAWLMLSILEYHDGFGPRTVQWIVVERPKEFVFQNGNGEISQVLDADVALQLVEEGFVK